MADETNTDATATTENVAISRETAESAFRSLIAVHSYKLAPAMRGFASLKYAMREVTEKPLDKGLEEAVLAFASREKADDLSSAGDALAKEDETATKKAAWKPMLAMLKGIDINVGSYNQATRSTDKGAYLAMIADTLNRIEAEHDIEYYLSPQETKEMQQENIQAFFIPIVNAMNADKDLLEAVRRKTHGEELRTQDSEALARNQEVAGKWEYFLHGLGMAIFTSPASNMDTHLTNANWAFNRGFYPEAENVESKDVPEYFQMATTEFGNAIKALDAVMQKYDGYETTININTELLGKLKKYGQEFEQAHTNSLANYEKKQRPVLQGIVNSMQRFKGPAAEKAQELYVSSPAPLGMHKDILKVLAAYKTAVGVLADKIAVDGEEIPLNSKEFIDVYTNLLALRERLDLTTSRAEIVGKKVAEIQADTTNKAFYASTAGFMEVVQKFSEYANDVAYGYGDRARLLKIPTSPTYIKAQGDALVEEIENPAHATGENLATTDKAAQIDSIDKAMLNFIRLRPMVETLRSYALQQSSPSQMPWASEGLKNPATRAKG